MQLIQFSAAQGPAECCLAVDKAVKRFLHEASQLKVQCQLIERQEEKHSQLPRSILLMIEGEAVDTLIERWRGTVLWIVQSPFRPKHKRKNWFIGVAAYTPIQPIMDSEIEIRTCRASGAGGQHVNTTDSAVQVTHKASGISVRMEAERSQHANKKLALLVLAQRLEILVQEHKAQDRASMRMQHHQLQRGDASLIFKGMAFNLQA